jgi:hypothetical protein
MRPGARVLSFPLVAAVHPEWALKMLISMEHPVTPLFQSRRYALTPDLEPGKENQDQKTNDELGPDR